MFHLNKMSLQNVINMNTSGLNATNPVLTRGEFTSSVVAKPLVRGAASTNVAAGVGFFPTTANGTNNTCNYPDGAANAGVAGTGCFTDDEAASSAWVARLGQGGNGAEEGAFPNVYNFNFPESSPLTYNPNLYLEINVSSCNRDFDRTAAQNGIEAVVGGGSYFMGTWTGRILFAGQGLETNVAPFSPFGTIQLRRLVNRGAGLINNQNLDCIVEFRLREIDSNDLGLNSYSIMFGNPQVTVDAQLRDMVVSTIGPAA